MWALVGFLLTHYFARINFTFEVRLIVTLTHYVATLSERMTRSMLKTFSSSFYPTLYFFCFHVDHQMFNAVRNL